MADNDITQPAMEQLRKNMQLSNIAKNVPAGARKAIASQALKSQVVQKQKAYYSAVRFQFAVTGAGPWTYTLAAGTRLQAFSYGVGDTNLGAAGFDATFGPATEADTNILTKGDTGGATVHIYGISLYIGELSDAHLTKQVWANTFADVTLNGSDRYVLLGRLGRIPAAGGLFGNGESRVLAPDTRSPFARNVGCLSNGMPDVSNYLRLTEPLQWKPIGSSDAKFAIRFQTARAITETATARAVDAAGDTAAFAPPTAVGQIGTYVDVVTYLHTYEFSPRSTQA